MAFDLEEQEQIESLKVFWHQWGKWISVAVVVAALGYMGYKAYRYHQSSESEKAAVVYDALGPTLASQDVDKVKAVVSSLQTDYADTVYAGRATLILSKLAFDKQNLDLAKNQLSWLLTHEKDSSILSIAHLRMATVLLDQKHYDDALNELNQDHDTAFDSSFLDLKGDIFVAKGQARAAQDAYKGALAKLPVDAPARQYVQTKLDALGGAV